MKESRDTGDDPDPMGLLSTVATALAADFGRPVGSVAQTEANRVHLLPTLVVLAVDDAATIHMPSPSLSPHVRPLPMQTYGISSVRQWRDETSLCSMFVFVLEGGVTEVEALRKVRTYLTPSLGTIRLECGKGLIVTCHDGHDQLVRLLGAQIESVFTKPSPRDVADEIRYTNVQRANPLGRKVYPEFPSEESAKEETVDELIARLVVQ